MNVLYLAVCISKLQLKPYIRSIGGHHVGNSIDKNCSNILSIRNITEHAIIKLSNIIKHFTIHSLILTKSICINWKSIWIFSLQIFHSFDFSFSWWSIWNSIRKKQYRSISSSISSLSNQWTCFFKRFICIRLTITFK